MSDFDTNGNGSEELSADRRVIEPILDLRQDIYYYAPQPWTTQSRFRIKYGKGGCAYSALTPLSLNRFLFSAFFTSHIYPFLAITLALTYSGAVVATIAYDSMTPLLPITMVGFSFSLFCLWYFGLMIGRKSLHIRSGLTADYIQLSPTSISLSWCAFGINLRSNPINLKDIALIHLERHNRDFAEGGYDVLSVRTFNGEALLLDSRDFESKDDFDFLIQALSRYARHAISSPALSLAVQPGQESALRYRYGWSWRLGIGIGRLRKAKAIAPELVLEPGTRLKKNRYEILALKGFSLSGVTYLARVDDRHLDADSDVTLVGVKDDSKPLALEEIRTVSIRQFIFPPDRSGYTERLLCRFEMEVRDTTFYTASGIARWLDVFVEQGRGFVVSEHVEGTALRKYIREQHPLSVERALDILIDLCDIVSSLHAEQLVASVSEGFFQVRPGYGFLSPDTFVITADGAPKMVEHPIVARIQSLSNLCPGLSFAYAAPERLTGVIIRQSDVYSLGAMLYFILTGKDPSPHVVLSPKENNPHVTPVIEELVAKMTNARVPERMQEIEEVKFAALDARSSVGIKRLSARGADS